MILACFWMHVSLDYGHDAMILVIVIVIAISINIVSIMKDTKCRMHI